jgi:hypothetical protein
MPHHACSILANSTSLFTSGMTGPTTSSAPKWSAHATRSGDLAGTNGLTPCNSSDACTHPTMPPCITFMYPAMSPSNKGLDHLQHAPYRAAHAQDERCWPTAAACTCGYAKARIGRRDVDVDVLSLLSRTCIGCRRSDA